MIKLVAEECLQDKFVQQVTERVSTSEDASRYLASRGINEDAIFKFGIGYFDDSEYSAFYRRILFPVKDMAGNVLTYQGRANFLWKDLGKPKYWHGQYDKSNFLYGLYENYHKILKEDYVFVVEGPIDVISLWQVGVPAVALFSTVLTKPQAMLLRMFTKNVVLLLDSDEAGGKGSDKAAKVLEDLDMNYVQVRSPGKDANEMYCDDEIGPEKLYNLCMEVVNAKFRTIL